jgi:hypothetical protein
VNDQVTVSTDDLAGHAPGYDAVRGQVRALYARLVSTLDNAGACWGDDDAGRAFAAKYVGPATSALNQLNGVAQGLDTVAGGVYAWAAGYQRADGDVASALG